MSLYQKNPNTQVVVVAAKRSAIGKVPGVLNYIHEVDLLAGVLKETAKGWDHWVDSAIIGSAFPIERDNLCRKAVLAAGLPSQINCATVSKTCASSDEALSIAYMQVLFGKARAVLAGGCEKVSNSPYILSFLKERIKSSVKMRLPHLCEIEKSIQEDDMRYIAEILAQRHDISREEQDSYTIKSRKKTQMAYLNHRFEKEIVPICYEKDNNYKLYCDEWVEQNFNEEEIRLEPPIFVRDGTLTKYNTAPLCDCATAMVVMSQNMAQAVGFEILTVIEDISWSGVAQESMGYAMVDCIKKILKENGLDKDEIDLYEINESFAAQAISVINLLELDIEKVNVNGGNLALGYPIGASGMRMCVTLIHEMIRSKARYGISAMCGGGAMANAILFKNRYV